MIKLLITDMDGTLVKGSLVLQFATFLADKGILPKEDIVEKWENDKKNESLIAQYGDFFRKNIKGLDYEYINILSEEFINSNIVEYNTQAINILNKCKDENYMCIILSGSCDFLIDKIANKLNIFGYGSLYEVKNEVFTGNILIPTFQYKTKKDIINSLVRKEYLDRVVGLGDTVSDIAIAEFSDEFYLVEPTNETRNEYIKLNVEFTEI